MFSAATSISLLRPAAISVVAMTRPERSVLPRPVLPPHPVRERPVLPPHPVRERPVLPSRPERPVVITPIVIDPPPEVALTLPSSADQEHLSDGVKCSLCCEMHKRALIFSGIVVVLTIIGVVIAISVMKPASNTGTNPCDAYKAEDFASSISLACFRTMWANAGCKTAIPDGYAGWYLRSPDGGKTVLCIPPKTGVLCGAGSFGTVQNSIWRCDLEYRGF